jgi:hypothetical protein
MNHKALILAVILIPSSSWAIIAKIPDKATLYNRILKMGLKDVADFDNFILIRRLADPQHKLTTKQVIMAVETVIYDITVYMKDRERAQYLQNQTTKTFLLRVILQDSQESLEHLAMYGYRQEESGAENGPARDDKEEYDGD